MINIPPTVALIGPLGPLEIGIILVIALLIFGKRLPEVGKSLGKGIIEFKKGLAGVKDDIEKAGEDQPQDHQPERLEPPHTSVNMTESSDTAQPTTAQASAANDPTPGTTSSETDQTANP